MNRPAESRAIRLLLERGLVTRTQIESVQAEHDAAPGDDRAAISDRSVLDSLVRRCEAGNLPLETFLPKKGDALIWASDLVHGGSRITNQNTRRSFVTHYCPVSVKPNFANFTKCYFEQRVGDNCYISSRHYDLRPDGLPTRLLNRLLQRQPYKRPIVT